jgi:hypothetical protein
MPCYPYKFAEGATGMICTGRGKKPRPCYKCGRNSLHLCDFPMGKTKAGKTKTCDKPMCAYHTNKGVSPDIDFCDVHYPIAKAAYERRTAKQSEVA